MIPASLVCSVFTTAHGIWDSAMDEIDYWVGRARRERKDGSGQPRERERGGVAGLRFEQWSVSGQVKKLAVLYKLFSMPRFQI